MRKWKRVVIGMMIAILALSGAFLGYTADYYHAAPTALSAMDGSATVAVRPLDVGALFDGPGDGALFVFYPGAKVEASAYAPLLLSLAEAGIDCALVEMPFRLAFFGANRVRSCAALGYDRLYLGGHSLGGAMAANYAAAHPGELDGLILLAAYATKPVEVPTISLYGSEDGVLNREKLARGEAFLPAGHETICLPGGNHAQFGDYGPQSGDAPATLPPQSQRTQTAEFIAAFIQK